MSSPSSDTTEMEEVRMASGTLTVKQKAVLARRRATSRKVPLGVDATQVKLASNFQFLVTLQKGFGLYIKFVRNPLGMWFSMHRNRFYLTDKKILLDSEC